MAARPLIVHLLFLFALTLGAHTAFATAFVLRGTVRDPSGNIVPGVKVALAGSNVLTDDEGKFELTLPERPKGKINFSRPGYGEIHLDLPDPANGEPISVILKRNQNDEGLIRYSTKISLSHSLTSIQNRERTWLRQPLTSEVYGRFVDKHGEWPPEEVVVRIYLPSARQAIRALLLISEHGIGGSMMEHELFRRFADRHGVALVGVLGDPIQRGIYPAEALESLLSDVGRKVGEPGMAQLPMFTFGHSNGTGFSVLQASLRPERTLGWVSYQSGGSWHLVFPGIENCPGLVMHGQKDALFVDQDKTVAMLRRERDAPVALLVAGDAAHWPSDRPRMYEVVIAFYEACLRVRAPRGVAKLEPVDLKTGWLGTGYNRAVGGLQFPSIAPYDRHAGDGEFANWLPDEAFARQWRNFMGSGSVNGANAMSSPSR
jgi:hypothetical protein